jgi:uncharacterized membrane protein (UPF0127 family)
VYTLAEVADTALTREVGLMNRRVVDSGTGMLFVYDKSQLVSFWMKDTLVPLDIIFIDESNVIVEVTKNATPLDIKNFHGPDKKVKYVLEVPAGDSDKFSYTVGRKLNFTK